MIDPRPVMEEQSVGRSVEWRDAGPGVRMNLMLEDLVGMVRDDLRFNLPRLGVWSCGERRMMRRSGDASRARGVPDTSAPH